MNIKRWMDLKGPHTLVNGIQASHMACKSPSLERDDNIMLCHHSEVVWSGLMGIVMMENSQKERWMGMQCFVTTS